MKVLKKIIVGMLICPSGVFLGCRENEENFAAQDFYGYANRELLEEAEKDLRFWNENGMDRSAQRIINNKIINALETIEPRNENEAALVKIYNSYVNFESREQQGIHPYDKYFDMIDNSSTFEDLINVDNLVWQETGRGVLFDIELREAGYGFSVFDPILELEFYEEEKFDVEKQYIEYLVRRISGNDEEDIVSKIFELQKNICSINFEGVMRECVSLDNVDSAIGKIRIRSIFNARNCKIEHEINVDGIDKLKSRCLLMYSTDLELLKWNFKVSLLSNNADLFDSELYSKCLEFRAKMKGADVPDYREIIKEYAVEMFKRKSPVVLEPIYLDYCLENEKVEEIKEFCKLVIDEYKLMVKECDLYSDDAKYSIVRRLENMEYYVPSYKRNHDEKYKLSTEEIGENLHDNMAVLNKNYSSFYRKLLASNYGLGEQNYSWIINAYNIRSTPDKFIYNGGYMEDPIYNLNMSQEEKIGGVISVIAHEVSHSFDVSVFNPGQADEEKNEAYKVWYQNLIDLYDGYEEYSGVSVSGEQVASESSSDIYGLACALRILKKKVKNPDYKKFFEAYARVNYRWYYLSEEKKNSKKETHPLPRGRVNCCVANFKEFYKAYNVKKNDAMYVEPSKRCYVK